MVLMDTDSGLRTNNYSMDLMLTTQSQNQQDLNTALERVKTFVYDQLMDTIFLDQSLESQQDQLLALGCKVSPLPAPPVDQIMGLVLLSKLNAIMCDKMSVAQLEISSSLGDDVTYICDPTSHYDIKWPPGWWTDPGPCAGRAVRNDTSSGVTVINPNNWADWNLAWTADLENKSVSTVVYADFKKNEKNPV
jgi:hypothetical protein